MTIRLRPHREDRPKTMGRLGQCNKSNRLMRRFYAGRKPRPRDASIFEKLER